MASIERPGLLAFASLPLPPEPTGPYQTVGLLLRIAGWVRLVMLGITILVALLAVFLLAVAGAVGTLATTFLLGPWGALGGLAAGFIVVALFVAIAVAVAIQAGFTWWTGWVYAKWVAKDPGAVQHVFVYGLVTTIVAGIGMLGIMGGNPGGLIDIGLLVIGILLIVQSKDPKMHLQQPEAAAPEGWKTVE